MARRKQRKKRTQRRPRPPAEATGSGAVDARKAGGTGSAATRDDGPPSPIWGDFPLVQLVVLAGLIVMVVGMFTTNPARVMIGLGLASLGGLELSVREHFSGYRSHSTLLAGVCFAVTLGVTGYGLRLAVWVCLLASLTVFAMVAWLLRLRFIRASGGASYRLR